MRRLLTAAVALSLLAGCGATSVASTTPKPTSRPTAGSAAPSPTPVVPPGATLLRDTFLKPGATYVTAGFMPRLTFSVPADAASNSWFASSTALTHTLTIGNPANEGAGVTIYQPTGGYDYAGHAAPLPADMVAWLTQDPQLQAAAPKPVTVGGIAGTEVDAKVIPDKVPNPPSLCHTNTACVLVASTDPDASLRPLQVFQGETFRIVILTVNGLAVILWVDGGTIGAAAQKLIDSIQFLPTGS